MSFLQLSTVHYSYIQRFQELHFLTRKKCKTVNKIRAHDFIFLEIDGDDFVAQSYAFLLAGFETSATTMAFTLYEMALQPAIQQRLRTEIVTVLEKHNQQVTYEAIQEMPYLEKVILGECPGCFHYNERVAYSRARPSLHLSVLQRL
jgi:hypothetical protein